MATEVPQNEVVYVSKPSETNPRQLVDWANAPSISDLMADLNASRPSHDRMISRVRRWRNHMEGTGEAAPKQVAGRSSVLPKLIRKHAEWRYPALSEPFLGQEDLFKCKPRTWEDAKASRQAELLLNYQFDVYIDKVAFIDEMVRAATDDGTVVVELGWDQVVKTRRIQVPVYSFFPVPEEEQEVIQQLQAVQQLRTENPNEYKNLDEEIRASAEQSEEMGMWVTAITTGYQEVEEQYYERNCPTAEICDIENIYVDPSCGGNLDKAMFAIRSFETSYGELKARGIYKNLELIDWASLTTHGDPNHDSKTPQEFQMEGKARNKAVAYRYYGFRDIHGTGELVPIVATWVAGVLIQLEENPFPDKKIPYVIGNLMPKRNSLFGEPDAELLIDNQATIGAITRGMIDLMARSANAQQAVPKGFLDTPNKRRFESGMDYEYNPILGDPRQMLIQHTYPMLPPSAMEMINANVQDAGSLTGVQTFNNDVNGDAYGQTAAGIKGVLAASSKRETSILRRLAKVVSKMGEKISQMNMEFLSDEEIIRVTNEEFAVVRREDLQGNYDVITEVSSAEADAAKSQKLAFMLQTIGPNVDFNITKMVMADIARLDKMDALAHALEKYEPPPPDPLDVALKEAEVAEAQAKVAKIQADAAEAQARAMYYAEAARNMGSKADLTDLDFVEQETGTKHAREMQKQQAQAEANQDLQVTKGILQAGSEGGPRLPELNTAILYNAISRNRQ